MDFPGTFFEYLQVNTQCAQSLDLTMKGYSNYRGSWLDAYSVEALISNAESGQVTVVDVGGGLVGAIVNGEQPCGQLTDAFQQGHDMQKLRHRLPTNFEAQVIVQEQSSVVGKADHIDGIEFMVHDFLTEQPVSGMIRNDPKSTVANSFRCSSVLSSSNFARLAR